jgi:hypothetical protein
MGKRKSLEQVRTHGIGGRRMRKCATCGKGINDFQENWNWGECYCHKCYQKKWKNVFYPHCYTCKNFEGAEEKGENNFCKFYENSTHAYSTCVEYEEED